MHTYDHAELQAYLAANVDGFTTLDAVEKVDGGQSNPTYALTSGTRRYVMRAKPTGELLPSAHQVDREHRVMSALANSGVAVPRSCHLSSDESPLGTMFFVMDHVVGKVHWNPALPKLDPAARGTIYDRMNANLAALHSVDVDAVGLSDFEKPGNYYERQVGRWSKQYRAAETETVADIEWVMDWLNDNMLDDDGQVAIVHGDYRIDNMMFDPKHRLLALLDWELSTLGHPMADLAYQCLIWRLPNAGKFKGLAGINRKEEGLPQDADYVAAYCERRGITEPAAWDFYMTFAAFRFISILQGVLKRGLDGNASNPLGADFMKAAILHLSSDAKRLAQGKG